MYRCPLWHSIHEDTKKVCKRKNLFNRLTKSRLFSIIYVSGNHTAMLFLTFNSRGYRERKMKTPHFVPNKQTNYNLVIRNNKKQQTERTAALTDRLIFKTWSPETTGI